MSTAAAGSRRERAVATLIAAGVDAEAATHGTLSPAALTAALGASAEVVEALGELGDQTMGATLGSLATDPALAHHHKALRRALHRLRERGVTVPELAPALAARVTGGPALEGLVTAVDGRGDRIIWLLRPLPSEGTLLVSVHLNEPAGVRKIQAAEVSRKQLRSTRRSLADTTGLRLVAADWRVLDALCVEAHERRAAPERDTDYLRIRRRLTEAPPLPPSEPVSSRVPAVVAEEATALIARSATLLDEPEFRSWWPTPTALEPYLAEIASVRESPLVLTPLQQQERLRVVLAAAAQALYPPTALARWLRATAFVLAESGRPGPAAVALALAAALAEQPESAAELPFVAALVQRGLGSLLATATRREEVERESALVLTPAELRARSSSHPSRTRA